MLLRSIDLNRYRTCFIFTKQVLNRIKIMLAHIAQAPSVVIPVSSEFCMNSFWIVWLEWRRTKPEVIVEFSGNRLWLQVIKTTPVEFPVVPRNSAYSDFKRPTKYPAVNQLLQRLYGCTQTIELIFEPEPCI
jgi:hypothetical protein